MALELRPISFSDAKEFVRENHRHNKPPVGHKFSIACYDGDRLCDTCAFSPPSSGDGKPCCVCDTDDPLLNCYQRRADNAK